jgi:hypothetical protein
MRFLKTLALLLFILTSLSKGTSFSTELVSCPACSREYSYAALMSWNTFMSGGDGPPVDHGECPHCLHSWTGEPKPLTEAQKKRHLDNLHQIAKTFTAKDRKRLTGPARLTDHELSPYLQAYSNWVLDDSKKLKSIPWRHPKPNRKSDKDLIDEKKEALAVLARMKRNSEPRAKIQEDLGRVFMRYIADWITLGDNQMKTFAVAWILWVPDSEFADSAYSLTSLATALHNLPKDQWPGIPTQTSTDPIILESLKYLRNERNWAKDFDQALVDFSKPGRTMWLTACAAARHDRAPAHLLLTSFNSVKSWQQSQMFPHYFEARGTSDDLPKLDRAHRYWFTLEKDRTSWWEVSTLVLGNLEESLRILRIRLILQNAQE